MHVIETADALRKQVGEWRRAGGRIGFVPTMGNLHAGHLALVDRARELAGRVVVSIFVNPMQFGPGEDIDRYPRTLDRDCEALRRKDVDLLFAPPVEVIYPHGDRATTRVEVPGLSDILEGEHRPGHFTGVATVVAKLFNLVQPDVAVFGEKDFQQLAVIRRMVADLDMPVRIVGHPTVREDDGLAMSSRNGYLDDAERRIAPQLYRCLQEVADGLHAGQPIGKLEAMAMKSLERTGFRPEYVSIRRRTDLLPPEPADHELIILAAAWLGSARLIDNLPVDV